MLLAAACNNQAAVQPAPAPQPVTQTPAPAPAPTTDPTAGWKTYTNAQYGFEFKYPTSLQMEIMQPSPLFVSGLKLVSESKSCFDPQNLASAVCIFSLSVGNGTGNLSKLGNPTQLTVGGKQATSISDAKEQLISIPFSANNYLAISYDNRFKNSTNDQILNYILASVKFTK